MKTMSSVLYCNTIPCLTDQHLSSVVVLPENFSSSTTEYENNFFGHYIKKCVLKAMFHPFGILIWPSNGPKRFHEFSISTWNLNILLANWKVLLVTPGIKIPFSYIVCVKVTLMLKVEAKQLQALLQFEDNFKNILAFNFSISVTLWQIPHICD